MRATDRQLGRVLVASLDQQSDLRRRTLDYVERSWRTLGSWREPDIVRWSARVAPVLDAAQARMATMTSVQVATVEQLVTGKTVKPITIDPKTVTTEALRGVPASDVYRRPGVEVWTSLAEADRQQQMQERMAAAIERGVRRAMNIAGTDLQLAKTHTAQRAMSGRDGVVGYRRLLTGSENCGLCVVASTQRYHVGELMPIHPGCECGVAPIIGNRDPGQVINQPLLDASHDLINSTFGSFDLGSRAIPGKDFEYRDVVVQHEHGEIGPVIAVRGHHFTGPGSL